MEEIWKAIPNYSSYEVSNLGRVKSLARECQHHDGTICHLKERILQQSITIKYRNGKIDYTKVKLVDDLEETIIGFLNSKDGGIIYLGVNDDGEVVRFWWNSK